MRQAWATAEGTLSLGQEDDRGLVLGEGRSCLSAGSELPLEVTRAHLPFLRQLLSYITKDKQTESLVEKLCQRFRTAR